MNDLRSTDRPLRRALTAVAALACAVTLLAAATSAPAAQAGTDTRGSHQKVTLVVRGCPGCDVTLNQLSPGRRGWDGRTKRVGDSNRLSWSVPAGHLRGLSASVVAPWERREEVGTGYRAQVYFRYAGKRTGSHVTVRQARRQSRGTQCLAGAPDRRHLVVPVTIRKVRVTGVTGAPTHGTLAFASRTQPYFAPMLSAEKGVGGAQDVPPCGPDRG